jgi:G3E family GTPase
MTKIIKLYLISGFLGAGKTTLVKQLLENQPNHKIGIIMNEFGKVSIDGPILKRDNMEMIELTRGSIFCSCLTMAFAEALIEMADKDLDYLVVESSGLADPSNIGDILGGVSQSIESPYVYSGSMTVVDAHQFLTSYSTIETIVKQIECADLTLINKADLVDLETMGQIKAKVLEINPDTEVIQTTFFREIGDLLGRDLSNGKLPAIKASLNTPENKPKTLSLQFEGNIEKHHLEKYIKAIMDAAFRVKGFVKIDEQWWEVHGVGDCVDFYQTDRQLDKSTLVIISKVGLEIIRTVDTMWKNHFDMPMKMVNG